MTTPTNAELAEQWNQADRVADVCGMQQLREAGRRMASRLREQEGEKASGEQAVSMYRWSSDGDRDRAKEVFSIGWLRCRKSLREQSPPPTVEADGDIREKVARLELAIKNRVGKGVQVDGEDLRTVLSLIKEG